MPILKGEKPILQGGSLVVAGVLLAAANFLVVLDTTIANVSVPHIAGGLAISPTEGTYVITSYAVAEAIIVPLTGWLASRFGTLRVFTTCMFLFGIFSALCGMAPSIGFLVMGRVLQGLAGGPMMPLSQTLLMQIFPKEKQAVAISLWSMTTLLAPIMGPIAGGYISDNWGWPFVFYINIPVAVICSFTAWQFLKTFETPAVEKRIDFIGLAILIIWVGALQIMLDEGKNKDWFSSVEIWLLLIVFVIGFAAFMIWELTEKHPIIDLRVFLHRGYSTSVLTISLVFGCVFSSVVLMPLWLQGYMGYTATWSGYTTAMSGILALFSSPFAAALSKKVDPRKLIFGGVLWIGFWTFFRSFGATNMTYAQIALPLLFQGLGMPFFFIPLTGLALASVEKEETASAAGLLSFLRTLSGAFATSVVTTAWENQASYYRSEIVNQMPNSENIMGMLGNVVGFTSGQTQAALLDQMVQSESIMLATNHIFLIVSLLFIVAASVIWLAPKPKTIVDGGAAH